MANTTNFNWETPDDTDLVKDGAAAIRTLGNSIDTSFVDLKGGTTGQILSKASNTDLDYTWIANDQGDITEVQAGTGISVASGTGPIPVVTNTVATAIDAKGDLIVGTGADTFARLAVGTNGHTLVADSAETTGLKWAAPAAGGKVLQVVSGTYSTQTTVASTTYTDSGLTLNITPSSASSKVMVLISFSMIAYGDTRGRGGKARIMRDATAVVDFGGTGNASTLGGVGATTDDYEQNQAILGFTYLDSPATTSATTYKVQLAVENAATGGAVRAQFEGATSTITLMEIGA
jgi:hypothetical protein